MHKLKAKIPKIKPQTDNPNLLSQVNGIDHNQNSITINVINEKPLVIYLNSQEIITNMTIGDFPKYLAVGYLLNQNMLTQDNPITNIQYDDDLQVVVVRTQNETNFEQKIQKKIRTSGCAQGTVFGDIMEKIQQTQLPNDELKLKISNLYALTNAINTHDSLYLQVGAIHGCVLCQNKDILVYMEDVGRHNAVDKIAGFMYLNSITPKEKILYTTGRLTSEMVIKTVTMGISILISRSGFTAWGVELAKQCNLTLIGRARGNRFIALAGEQRLVYDAKNNQNNQNNQNLE